MTILASYDSASYACSLPCHWRCTPTGQFSHRQSTLWALLHIVLCYAVFAGSCKLPPSSPGLLSKSGCVALNPQPLTASGELTCPDKAVATFKAASCNYTGKLKSGLGVHRLGRKKEMSFGPRRICCTHVPIAHWWQYMAQL